MTVSVEMEIDGYYTEWRCVVCREMKDRSTPIRVSRLGEKVSKLQCQVHGTDADDDEDVCLCHCHGFGICYECGKEAG